jgi:hypothetical protein
MGKYTFWLDGQVVDGAGHTLDRHAATLADKLKFSAEQRALVVAELRNVVPTLVKLEDEPESRMRDIVGRGVERVLQLADAIDRSVSGADVDWYAVSYCAPVKWCSGSAALEGYFLLYVPEHCSWRRIVENITYWQRDEKAKLLSEARFPDAAPRARVLVRDRQHANRYYMPRVGIVALSEEG